jgi:hypothetical protein
MIHPVPPSCRNRFVTAAEFNKLLALVTAMTVRMQVKPDGVGKMTVGDDTAILDLTVLAGRVGDIEDRLGKATVVCNEDGTITLTI